MKYLFTLTFVFVFLSVQSKPFYSAKITLVNGQKKEGFAHLPSNKMLDNAIRFKTNNSAKPEKIKEKDIDQIQYTTETGNNYVLVRNKTRRIMRFFGKVREDVSNKKAWLLLKFQHSKINYYYYAQSYKIDKEGAMIAKTVDRSGMWADIFLLLKRPNEEIPTIITSLSYGAVIIGKEKRFRKYSKIYFSDNKSLVKRIDDKEFKHDKMEDLIKAYIQIEE